MKHASSTPAEHGSTPDTCAEPSLSAKNQNRSRVLQRVNTELDLDLGESDGFLTMLEWDFLGISLLEYK